MADPVPVTVDPEELARARKTHELGNSDANTAEALRILLAALRTS